MLLVTLMLMGILTVIIGLLPTFESIGYWATVCLIILRFIQGMAMGGEWGGQFSWLLNMLQKVERVLGKFTTGQY